MEGAGEQTTEEFEDQDAHTWHGDLMWAASAVLQSAFESAFPVRQCSHPLAGLKILEFGSGTGCLGLALAAGGAEVTMSDLPENTKLARENVERNEQLWSTETSSDAETGSSQIGSTPHRSRPRVIDLLWQDSSSFEQLEAIGALDYVIASDCIYNPEVARMLFLGLYRAAETSFRSSGSKRAPRVLIANVGRWHHGVLADIRAAGFDELRRLSANDLSPIEMLPEMEDEAKWESIVPHRRNAHVFEAGCTKWR
jgi:predicted nicotinamide N-methyase